MSINFDSIPDGLVVFLASGPNSNFLFGQQGYLETLQESLKTNNIFVQVVNQSKSELDSRTLDLISQIQPLAKKSELEDCLIFTIKTGHNFKLLTFRHKPEAKYNWVEIIIQFSKNYFSPDPDQENLYSWGQIVVESGEYLCRDCGYIETFEAGQVFPVCEVCLAGDPEGPMEISAGYWEKI